jgi:arginine exporter protein ArgO
MNATKITGRAEPRLSQRAALGMGGLFLLAGVLGFIPGITSDYGEMRFAGPHSAAQLFDVFTVSVLHNLVHLLFGVLGVVAARYTGGARAYLMIGGGVYLLLWVYGLGTDNTSHANFVPMNNADNWLHLGLGLAMVALGIATTAIDRRHGDFPAKDIRKA